MVHAGEPASAYVPALQLMHSSAPELENVPGPHCVQPLAPAPEYVPASQRMHSTAPASEYMPPGHVPEHACEVEPA